MADLTTFNYNALFVVDSYSSHKLKFHLDTDTRVRYWIASASNQVMVLSLDGIQRSWDYRTTPVYLPWGLEISKQGSDYYISGSPIVEGAADHELFVILRGRKASSSWDYSQSCSLRIRVKVPDGYSPGSLNYGNLPSVISTFNRNMMFEVGVPKTYELNFFNDLIDYTVSNVSLSVSMDLMQDTSGKKYNYGTNNKVPLGLSLSKSGDVWYFGGTPESDVTPGVYTFDIMADHKQSDYSWNVRTSFGVRVLVRDAVVLPPEPPPPLPPEEIVIPSPTQITEALTNEFTIETELEILERKLLFRNISKDGTPKLFRNEVLDFMVSLWKGQKPLNSLNVTGFSLSFKNYDVDYPIQLNDSTNFEISGNTIISPFAIEPDKFDVILPRGTGMEETSIDGILEVQLQWGGATTDFRGQSISAASTTKTLTQNETETGTVFLDMTDIWEVGNEGVDWSDVPAELIVSFVCPGESRFNVSRNLSLMLSDNANTIEIDSQEGDTSIVATATSPSNYGITFEVTGVSVEYQTQIRVDARVISTAQLANTRNASFNPYNTISNTLVDTVWNEQSQTYDYVYEDVIMCESYDEEWRFFSQAGATGTLLGTVTFAHGNGYYYRASDIQTEIRELFGAAIVWISNGNVNISNLPLTVLSIGVIDQMGDPDTFSTVHNTTIPASPSAPTYSNCIFTAEIQGKSKEFSLLNTRSLIAHAKVKICRDH